MVDSQGYTGMITIWPEWLEQDLLLEKWNTQAGGPGTASVKDPKSKGTSFEDPEGRTRLPHGLALQQAEWKRPQDLFGDNLCIVRNTNHINLKEPNEHLMHSEFMRHHLSHIMLLWYNAQRKKLHVKKTPVVTTIPVVATPSEIPQSAKSTVYNKDSKHNMPSKDVPNAKPLPSEPVGKALCFEDPMNDWAPWNLIYGGPPQSTAKIPVGKGDVPQGHPVVNLPQYNPYGKYAVKLFWMGSWRKIIVDDFIPVDEKNRPLLPVCEEKYELWPVILTKAVLKVVSLDFGGGTANSEIGDQAFLLSVLTGYIPYVAYLDHPQSTRKAIWNKLQALLPLNKKSTSEELLSSLALNWDVRSAKALKAWKTENEPDYHKKIESIRALRVQSSAANSQGVGGGTMAQALEKTPSMLNTLTPKTMARSASARNTSAAPRKLDFSTLPTVAPSPSSQDIQKVPKVPKTPEVIVYATYRSAHHDHKIFDQNANSRSDKLYSSGFLRTESHPILIRQLKDIYPREVTVSPVPKFKLFRPLKNVFPSFSKEIALARRKNSRPVRSVDFLSLFWRDKERLVHQTSNRAAKLTANCTTTCSYSDEKPTQPKYRPMDGYRPTLPALPENSQYPRKKIKPPPELTIEPVSPPPPTPIHGEKTSVKHSKPAENKPGVPPPPEVAPLPPVHPPCDNTSSLQKKCRLNKGSLEFNQFYNSLETVYVFCKPETFDFQSSFSFYQPNILADGRPPPTKKKNNEASQLNVDKAEGIKSAPASTKSPASPVPVKYGKVTTDLPCPLLFVDNPHPTSVVICVAAFSRWFYVPKTDLKSQEKFSIVAGTMEELKNMEKPLPLMVSLKPFDWMRISTTQPTLWTIKTSSVQGVCYHIPAGRHVFRLKVVCPGRKDLEPHGYVIRALSRDPVQIGSEDIILKLLGSDSYQYSALARKSLIPILRWWKLNGIVSFTHPPHRDVINILGLDEDACDKHTRRMFSDAMLQAIYTAIQVCLKEFCTAKVVFALRVFLGDVITKNPLNLTPAQLAKKDSRVITIPPVPTKAESHSIVKPVEGPPLGKRAKKGAGGESATPSARQQRQLNTENAAKEAAKAQPKKAREPSKPDTNVQQAKAIVYFQLYFQVAKSSHIREARRSGSKRKEQVLRTAQELLDAILKNEYLFANCFFRTLCRNLPEDWLDLSFFYHQEKRYVFREYSGNFPELHAHTWKLFFRDTFFVNEPMAIAFKLTTNTAPCRLTVVDNDTGEVCPSALSHPLPHFYEKNSSGYSVVAEAKAGTVAWRANSWSLKIIEALDPFKHEVTQADSLLVKFGSPSPTTNFLTKELTDYFLPDTSLNPAVASVVVKVKGPQSLATICFTASNSDALFVMAVLLDGNPVHKEYGRGTTVVPVYPFKAEPGMYAQYHIRVECLEDSWPLNGADWKFIYAEKSKRLAVEYGRDSPLLVQSISPVTKEKGGKKGPKSAASRDKSDKSDKESVELPNTPTSARKKEEKESTSIKTPKEAFDINKPHWNIKFLVDTTDTEFEVKRDTESEDGLKAELAAAMAVDPGILQRGKEQREDFLKKAGNAGFHTPDLPEFPGWVNGSTRSTWPAPVNRCPLSFDIANLIAPSAGDGPTGEIDLFVHQNRMAVMRKEYEEALANRNAFVKGERAERDQFIRRQDEFLRKLVDNAVSNRRKYIEQREVFKKEFDEVALEEQRRLVAAQTTSPVPKADEKHKKGKKG